MRFQAYPLGAGRGPPGLRPLSISAKSPKVRKADRSPSYQAVDARHGNDFRRRCNLILMFSVVSDAPRPYANHFPAARGGC